MEILIKKHIMLKNILLIKMIDLNIKKYLQFIHRRLDYKNRNI